MKYGYLNPKICAALGKRFDAYLNGKKINYVVESDDIDGFVICHVIDGSGALVIKNGDFVCEKIYGNVELIQI